VNTTIAEGSSQVQRVVISWAIIDRSLVHGWGAAGRVLARNPIELSNVLSRPLFHHLRVTGFPWILGDRHSPHAGG
jgi:hypothetical protein